MKILVLIKQVPETSNVRMDTSTGTIIREGVESIVNPLDLYAIETALRLKKTYGATVTAISMGPSAAEKCIKEAIAMGCDDGVLLSSHEFAGSDTWATSMILSKACAKIGDFDLILAGERATDGDTAQVGPEVASLLDIPLATYVSSILKVNNKEMIIERLVEKCYESLLVPFPCLVTVLKEIAVPRLPTLRGKQNARAAELQKWSINDLPGICSEEVGLAGSPTQVVKISTPKVARHGINIKIKDERDMEPAIEALVQFLKDKNLIPKRGQEI